MLSVLQSPAEVRCVQPRFRFSFRESTSDWDPDGRIREYGWGGAASTHYWTSAKDDLTVITIEQVMPYSILTDVKIK